jgi:hypothetical protein
MIYGQLGRTDEARAAAGQILQMDPEFEQNAWYEIHLRNFPPEMAQHMAEGLRKAGLSIPGQPRRLNDPSSRSS